MLLSAPVMINHNFRCHSCERIGRCLKIRSWIDADWRTLCDTLRGSIAMFDMLLAECGDSSETARVVGDARRRREKVLRKDREAPVTLTVAANFASVRSRVGRRSSGSGDRRAVHPLPAWEPAAVNERNAPAKDAWLTLAEVLCRQDLIQIQWS